MTKAILTGILNVIVPGAGMAVLKQWKMALGYFVCIPVFLIGSYFTLNLMSGTIIEVNGTDITLGSVDQPLIWLALLIIALGVVIWDAFVTPYKFFKGEARNYNVAALTLMSIFVPGLGFIPMKKWGYVLGYTIWAPLGLILGGFAFGAVFNFLFKLIPSFSNPDAIAAFLASILARVLVIWESGYYTYQIAKKMTVKKEAV